MRSHPTSIATLAFLILTTPFTAAQAQKTTFGESVIQSRFAGDFIQIRTTSRLAGAIDSLTWRGKEFVNSFDHGRQIQSSAHFNGAGICLNPTEAGSRRDGVGVHTSSELLKLEATGNTLSTLNRPAFWLLPGEHSDNCPPHFNLALNSTVRSDHLISKRVTIGYRGMPNVIEYALEYTVSTTYHLATIEIVTGYMPPEFSQFWRVDLITGMLKPLSDGPGEQAHPVIFSTEAGDFAMGVYNEKLPLADWPNAGYGRWRFQNAGAPTVKWNCVQRVKNMVGSKGFKCYIAIGTLTDVKQAILRLSNRGDGAP